jgi:hypothetical protein
MNIVFVGNFGVDYSSETHHANTLESLGNHVVRLQEGQTTGDEILVQSLESDCLVFVHTHGWVTPGLPMERVFKMLKRAGIPTLTYHLDLWLGLERQKDLTDDPFYSQIEHFWATDKLMADWFNEKTDVKGHYIPAGVYEPETYLDQSAGFQNDVIFVGSKGYHHEWGYRPLLINKLGEMYGDKFKHFGGDGLGVVRGPALNQLYGSSKIAVGDTLCIGFDYPYYFSDRLFESTGRGGFTIFPYIKGIEDNFEIGTELVCYKFNDFDDLQKKIDYYLEHDDEREKIRIAGHERTKRDHTYNSRWKIILGDL